MITHRFPIASGLRKACSAALLACLVLTTSAFAGERRDTTVEWVTDGDTFRTRMGEKVRLIGVNTPEYQPRLKKIDPYGKEASDFLKVLLPEGQAVTLETDVELKDKYGRTLAYVHLPDGRFVNLLLVQYGLARVKAHKPNIRYHSVFKSAEKAAKAERIGLWAESRVK